MPQTTYDSSGASWNAQAFCNKWRSGMFIEINDYRGPRSQWKRRRLLLVKKNSSEVWHAIELTLVNCRMIAKGKLPEPIEITLEYITTPQINFICDQLPQDLGY